MQYSNSCQELQPTVICTKQSTRQCQFRDVYPHTILSHCPVICSFLQYVVQYYCHSREKKRLCMPESDEGGMSSFYSKKSVRVSERALRDKKDKDRLALCGITWQAAFLGHGLHRIMNRLANTDLHLTFRNWSSSNSEMSETENSRDTERERARRGDRQITPSEHDGDYLDSNDTRRLVVRRVPRSGGRPADLRFVLEDTRDRSWSSFDEANGYGIQMEGGLMVRNRHMDATLHGTEGDDYDDDYGYESDNINTMIDPDLGDITDETRRNELYTVFNVIRRSPERGIWHNTPSPRIQQHLETRPHNHRPPSNFENYFDDFINPDRHLHMHDLYSDHFHNDEDPSHYLNLSINTDGNARLRDFKNRFARSNTVYGNMFFKNHPNHEMDNFLHIKIEKYGLTTMMNQLLMERNQKLIDTHGSDDDLHRKRRYKDACVSETSMDTSNEPAFTKLTKSSFLQNGTVFSSPTKISNNSTSLNFTNVDYEDLKTSGFFKVGNVKLGFTGEIVDFINTDLRYDTDNSVLLESNAFSNMLRNKLVHEKHFSHLFEKTNRKIYTKETWKPFSMDRMGYIKFNQIHTSRSRKQQTSHKILPLRCSKFPNGSVFHKMKASGDNKFDLLKMLSRWYDVAPLNQYTTTPSPPTPPHNMNKCINNPENLLTCESCINLILSKYLFLKLEIDIEELFKEDDHVFSDYIYKHRRRFNYYANKLVKKNNHNLRTHLERDFAQNNYSLASHQQSNVMENGRDISNQTSTLDLQESNSSDDRIDRDRSSDLDNEDNGFEEDDIEMMMAQVDNEIGHQDYQMDTLSSGETQPESEEDSQILGDPWPISDERSDGLHPVLDPTYNEDSDDDLESPYSYIVHNDNRRISRLLFNINLVRQQYVPYREPMSSLKMYKNAKNERMKLIMMVSINRKTGELQMVPGNMDPNSWSSEQNDGELFEDIESFGKVFNLFMNDKEQDYEKNTKFTKETKRWIKTKHSVEAEEIKRLLALQVLVNPSILKGYREHGELKKHLLNKLKNKKQELFKKPSIFASPGRRLKRKRNGIKEPKQVLNDELREKIELFMEETNNFDVDSNKVITMFPGLSAPERSCTHGSSLAFELE